MKSITSVVVIIIFIIGVGINGCENSPDSVINAPPPIEKIDSDQSEQNNDILSTREYNPNLQIVIVIETDYGKAVCREVNPNLREDNFELWYYPTHIDTIFRSIYERYKDLPPNQWPVICIPTPNFEAVDTLMKIDNRYKNMAVVMPYIYTGGWFTNFKNYAPGKIFKPVLVGAGNHRYDWTKGNKLDFTDSVNIQYVNPAPVYNYVITSIENIPGRTRVRSPMLVQHAQLGSQVWFSFLGSAGSIYNRFCIIDRGSDFVDIYQVNIGNFISGTAKCNFLSGAVFSVGAKLNHIMRETGKGFKETVQYAKEISTNRPDARGNRWNDSTGFGYVNYLNPEGSRR